MIKEGIEGVEIVYYDKSPNSEDAIRNELLDAHLVIVIGTDGDACLFNTVGRISRSINLLTVGIGIASSQPCAMTMDAFDTLFLTSCEQLSSNNQSATDFLNLACAGLAEVLGYRQRFTTDFMDVKEILTQTGLAVIGSGVGTGASRSLDALTNALDYPTLKGMDFKSGSAAYLILKTNSEIQLSEFRLASDALYRASGSYASARSFSDDATCLNALIEGGDFADEIRVTVIVTGLS